MEWLEDTLGDLPGVEVGKGMGAANRFPSSGWELSVLQQFQFGDLRLESPRATVVVELESAGGITNLVKFWPLLAADRQAKRFVLAHVFWVTSEFDYIAHRRLWEFVVDRMKDDLSVHPGLQWPSDWEARLFTYRSPEDLGDAAGFIGQALAQ